MRFKIIFILVALSMLFAGTGFVYGAGMSPAKGIGWKVGLANGPYYTGNATCWVLNGTCCGQGHCWDNGTCYADGSCCWGSGMCCQSGNCRANDAVTCNFTSGICCAEGKCWQKAICMANGTCCGNGYCWGTGSVGGGKSVSTQGGQAESITVAKNNAVASRNQITGTNVENIYDLIKEGKIEVETEGSGISSLSLKIKPKVELNIKVSIPVGTFFSANEGSSQSMISTKDVTVELEVKPGFDVDVDVSVACTNMHKAVPKPSDTFEIERTSNNDELGKLLPVLEAEDASYPVKQAAIWIITDNAGYSDLGTLVCGNGERVITESEASEAMRLIAKAGIDINNKAISKDRDEILKGNTGKPSCYTEGTVTTITQPVITQPVTMTHTVCGDCPAGYQGPDANCECSKWVYETVYE